MELGLLETVKELPGVVVVRCDQRLYGLMERWPLKDGGWGERQSRQRTGWMTSMNDLARELSEVQNLDQSHELETRVPPCLIMHATERYPPRLAEAILRCLSIGKMVFIFMPWKLGLDHMLTMTFKLPTSMRLDYLHRSTMTNALA